MDRDLLPHLAIVLAVARRGGFAAAAAELGLGASAVSHAVRLVEERLGTPLFARTTRSVALTEAGDALVRRLGPALAEIGDAVERAASLRGQVVGLLRLSVPRVALAMAVTPVLARLAERHPALTVEIDSDDGLVDILAAGCDAGIRLGGMIAQDMTAVRLTPPFRAVTVAAPAYLARRGAPADLADLQAHNCVGFRLVSTGATYAWDLARNGEDVKVPVTGSAIVSDPTYARDLALAGIGIAYVFEPLVAADIAAGRLVPVLEAAAIEEPGLFLYCPPRSSGTPKLRAFIEAARAVLRPGREA